MKKQQQAKEEMAKMEAEEAERQRLLQAKLLASQEKDDRIRLLEAEVARLRALETHCIEEKTQLWQYIEYLREEGARQIGDLRAQLYSLHREHEDLLGRLREDKSRDDAENKSDGLKTRRHRRAYSHDRKDKKDKDHDYVASMKDHTASLFRRRPNAMFNSRQFKVQFFRLTGEKLHYYALEGDKKPKNSYDLRDYLYAEQCSTQEGRFTFRLLPGKKLKGNALVEFKQLEGEDSDADRFIFNWFYELNRRIAIIRYLADVKGGVQPGVEELFDFCMDDKAQTLELEHDKFMGFSLALNTLKRAIMYRPNLHTVFFVYYDYYSVVYIEYHSIL